MVKIVNANEWKVGSPIYYMMSLGNETYDVLNAGSGYSYNLNASYALTSNDNSTLRFEVRPGDHNWFDAGSGSERSEISSQTMLRAGVPIEVKYTFNLEQGAPNTAKWFVAGQFIQDTSTGVETATPPPFAVTLAGEKMVIMVRYKDAGGHLVERSVFTDSANIERGHSYDFDIKAVFDASNAGRLVVVRDGVVIADYSGPMGYEGMPGVHWKEGLYRSPSQEVVAATYGNLQITSGDMVTIPKPGTPFAQAHAAPTLSLSGPVTHGNTGATAHMGVTAVAGSIVKLYDGEKMIATGATNANGHLDLEISHLGAGSHALTATATSPGQNASALSHSVIVEIGTAADVLARIDYISAKQDLAEIILTDTHTFTVSSLAQMSELLSADKNALNKIAGGYNFQFYSGTPDNRTLSSYDSSGALLEAHTKTYQNGALVRETINHYTHDADIATEVFQYNIAGKTYSSMYQAFNQDGAMVLVTRSRADGTLEYKSIVDASGTTTFTYAATGSVVSKIIAVGDTVTTLAFSSDGVITTSAEVHADKSSDTKYYTKGVLTSEVVVHASTDSSGVFKETFTYNVQNASYVSTHQSYSASGQLLSATRTHVDGSLDYLYRATENGSSQTEYYNAKGDITAIVTTLADKSSDTKLYTDGVLSRETILHAGASANAKEVYDYHIAGKSYGTIHRVYDSAGKQVLLEYLTPAELQIPFAPATQVGTKSAPTLAIQSALQVAKSAETNNVDTSHGTTENAAPAIALTGSASARAVIKLLDGDHLVGTTTADANGNFSILANSFAAGHHALSAQAIDIGGHPSELSSKISLDITSTSDFIANIAKYNAMPGLGTIWLNDGDVLTVAAGRLPDLLSKYGKALSAIQGEYSFEVWSGPSDHRTVARYDMAGLQFETETKTYVGGALVRDVVIYMDEDAPLAREVYQYGFVGKSYTASYQAYDSSGRQVISTRSHADGSLDFHASLASDGTLTSDYYDATGLLKARGVTSTDGSVTTTTFDKMGTLTTWSVLNADKSSVTEVYAGTEVTNKMIVHAIDDGSGISREYFSYGLKGQDFTSTHTAYDTSGHLALTEKFRFDGTLISQYGVGNDGTSTTNTYDAEGQLTKSIIMHSAATGLASKEVFEWNAAATDYVSKHFVYDDAGKALLEDFGTAAGSHAITLLARDLTVTSTGANEAFVSNGSDAFVFNSSFGSDTIRNFHAGSGFNHDTISFGHGIFANDDPLFSAYEANGNVVITASNHDTITLLELHKADLLAANFHLI